MKRNIVVAKMDGIPINQQAVEMVERKGVGHPDSIMDGMMEAVSRELSKYYVKEFGEILHHNTDKGQLSSGQSNPVFGGGEIIAPISILLSGQATEKFGNEIVPVHEIAIEAARAYLHEAVPNIDMNEGVDISSRIVTGSSDLRDLYGRKVPAANDTSFGVGFAPLSTLERLVLETEHFLNSKAYQKKHPAVGPDIKVMGTRFNQKQIDLTIAIAFVSKHVKSLDDYVAIRERIAKDVTEFVRPKSKLPVKIFINTCDNISRKSIYMTVTGTSAEMGDAGSVGRGNRVNGLITPNRTMSLEAAAGKNPVRHVGKIYNLSANEIAKRIVDSVPTVKEAEVKLLSQIGHPIDQPLVASVIIMSKQYDKDIKRVQSIVDDELAHINRITKKCIEGKLNVW